MLTYIRLAVLWALLHPGLLGLARSIFPVARGDPSWYQYVRAPPSRYLQPAAVLSQYTLGNVSNAQGMIDGLGPTKLSRTGNSSQAPTVVVDFGQNVVGLLTINFGKSMWYADASPGLRLTYSETLEYLTNRSDFTRSDNADTVRPLTYEGLCSTDWVV